MALYCVTFLFAVNLQTEHRRDLKEASRLKAAAEASQTGAKSAEEAKLALQFKVGELVVAMEDLQQQKETLHSQLLRERDEVWWRA